MAYFAELQNDIVQQIIVVSDDTENGAAWCVETYGGVWVQTVDDGLTRFAQIGDTYDYATQTFIAPEPEPTPDPEPVEP